MSKMQRIYNKETLPREFKFRVNKKQWLKRLSKCYYCDEENFKEYCK